MSAICIGGCCIPYSAIVPLLLVALQFLAKPLYAMGLLPDVIATKLGLTKSSSSKSCEEKSCCSEKVAPRTESSVSSTLEKEIVEITSSDELDIYKSSKKLLLLKMTADWCKPCKAIQPLYESLCQEYASQDVIFATVDVDECDDIAGEYGVAMMPTFVALNQNGVVEKMSGSNEARLQDFVKRAVASH
ncbi:hypothetical protein CTEN210_00286 [Chaetoceros tenuissimus]|uniref:Thioredoxin domain-containing protein n=1 Tax=Chaetoceros tenuissimus TaxID=426638 RepID=A0AAD3CDY4_9STRA|nr:hypothetical protein CTEN210_00286 [Chaetoceros tenuissimus]